MWLEAELILKSYKPLNLEKGMFFIQKLHQDTIKETVELFQLNKVPQNEEEFIQRNGYPVELFIIDASEQIIATPEQIGWMDDGGDELHDITLKELNIILNDYDGMIDIEVDAFGWDDDECMDCDDEGFILPVIYDGKVTVRFFEDEEEEEDEGPEYDGAGFTIEDN